MNKKAFTLLELLVVVLIIGILAAIALPQYKYSKYRTEYAELETIVKTLAQAGEMYYLTHNEFPNSFDQLDVEFPGNITTENSSSNYTYRYYGGFPNKGHNLNVNSAGSWYATNAHNSFVIYHRFAKLNDNSLKGKRFCYATSEDKIAQKVCKNATGKSTYDRTVTSSSRSSWGNLANKTMYLYFY